MVGGHGGNTPNSLIDAVWVRTVAVRPRIPSVGGTSEASPQLPVHVAHRDGSGTLPDQPGKIAHAESTACSDPYANALNATAAECATRRKFVQSELVKLS